VAVYSFLPFGGKNTKKFQFDMLDHGNSLAEKDKLLYNLELQTSLWSLKI